MVDDKCEIVLKLLVVLICGSYGTQIRDIPTNTLDLGFGDDVVVPDKSIIYQNKLTLMRTRRPVVINMDADVEKVTLQIYYECLCPDCRELDSQQLVPLVQKLGYYLNIHTYPYGNAQTHQDGDGNYSFTCQHGPSECYGNMLHACVIDALQNNSQAVLFNACMMDRSQAGRGSDDRALDVCGKAMGLDTTAVKQCAKGERGSVLLKYYGDESKKVKFNYVPYILINGKVNNGDHLIKDVCEAFKNPPGACNAYI